MAQKRLNRLYVGRVQYIGGISGVHRRDTLIYMGGGGYFECIGGAQTLEGYHENIGG